MISIVIAYFNRKKLFQSTLESLKQSKCKEDFEVIVVDGEDVICEREHDVSYAAHMRQCRIDICYYYGYDVSDLVEDETVSF